MNTLNYINLNYIIMLAKAKNTSIQLSLTYILHAYNTNIICLNISHQILWKSLYKVDTSFFADNNEYHNIQQSTVCQAKYKPPIIMIGFPVVLNISHTWSVRFRHKRCTVTQKTPPWSDCGAGIFCYHGNWCRVYICSLHTSHTRWICWLSATRAKQTVNTKIIDKSWQWLPRCFD